MSKLHTIYQYDETGQGLFESSWYGYVSTTESMLKFQIKGMPFDAHFIMDKRAIPQLIQILKQIQNEDFPK
jgi:hypothetical protein